MDIDLKYEFNAPKFCDFEALDAFEDHADEVFDFQIVGDITAETSGQDATISKLPSSVTVHRVGPPGRGLTTAQLLKADHPPRSERKRDKFPSGRRQWAVHADAPPHVTVAFADDSRTDASPDLRKVRPVRKPIQTTESSAATSGLSHAMAISRTSLRQPLRPVQPAATGGARLPGAPSDGHHSVRSHKLAPSKRTLASKVPASTDGHRTYADENGLSAFGTSSRLGLASAGEHPTESRGLSCSISNFPVKSSKVVPQRNSCRFTKGLPPPAIRCLSPAAAVVDTSTCYVAVISDDANSFVAKSLESAKPVLCKPHVDVPPADVVAARQIDDASAPITLQVSDSAEAATVADGHRQQTHVAPVLVSDVINVAPVADGVSTCGKMGKSLITVARVAGHSCKLAGRLGKNTTESGRKQDEDRRANAGATHQFVRPYKRVLITDRPPDATARKIEILSHQSGIGHSKATAERQPLQPFASRLNSLRPTNNVKPSADPSCNRLGVARVKRDADRQLTAAASTAASHASSRLHGTGATNEVVAAPKPAASARRPPIPPARSTGRQVFSTECRRPQRQQQQQPQKRPLPGTGQQQPKERSQSSRPLAASALGHSAALGHSTALGHSAALGHSTALGHSAAVASSTMAAAGTQAHHRCPGHIRRYKPLVIRRSSRPPTKPLSPHFSSKVSKKSRFAA